MSPHQPHHGLTQVRDALINKISSLEEQEAASGIESSITCSFAIKHLREVLAVVDKQLEPLPDRTAEYEEDASQLRW